MKEFMMIPFSAALLAIGTLTALFLPGCEKPPPPFECADPVGCVHIAPGEPVKIGVLQDLSQTASGLGIDQLRSIEISVDDHDGRLLGHPLLLQKEDSLCSPEGGKLAAAKLATDPQVVGIIGTTCSGSAKTAGTVISEAGLVMISGSNSAPSLTSVGGKRGAHFQPGYFRTRPPHTEMGRVAAEFAFRRLGISRAAIINDGDTYTRELSLAFHEAFEKMGGKTVLDAAVDKGDKNMVPVLTAVADSGAQIVFLPLFFEEALAIVQQAKERRDLAKVRFMGAAAIVLESFVEALGDGGRGMYFVRSALPESQDKERLIAGFERKFGHPPRSDLYAHGQDAANLLLAALEEVADVEADGRLHIGRLALRDALYATRGFEGITGTLDCDEFGDCGVTRGVIVRLEDPAAGLEGLKANVVYVSRPDR